MQHLSPPYTPIETPVFTHSGRHYEVQEAVSFSLAAVAFGHCYHLHQSPYAIHRLNLNGVGYFQHPRIEKLLTPARAKLLNISPDQTRWDFALSKQLQMRICIRSSSDLPVVHRLIEPGMIHPAGTAMGHISTHALRENPMVTVQIRVLRTVKPFAVKVHTGNKSAAEDTALTLHQITDVTDAHLPYK